MAGRLFGVGVGPGDPELVTVKAARLIADADVVAFHCARHGRSIARSVAEPYLRDGQIEEQLVYPVTTETTGHPGGYQGALDEFYADCAARLATHLDAGRTVVVLSEGDPLFYGSYMHLHKRLAPHYPTEVVPGVTSLSAASAAAGRPLVEREETLTVLPGTLPGDELTRRLRDTDAAAVLKLGRTFTKVRQAFEGAGLLGGVWYVELALSDRPRGVPLAGVDPATSPTCFSPLMVFALRGRVVVLAGWWGCGRKLGVWPGGFAGAWGAARCRGGRRAVRVLRALFRGVPQGA
jgi:precorrin-2 C(20)-methyltransferase